MSSGAEALLRYPATTGHAVLNVNCHLPALYPRRLSTRKVRSPAPSAATVMASGLCQTLSGSHIHAMNLMLRLYLQDKDTAICNHILRVLSERIEHFAWGASEKSAAGPCESASAFNGTLRGSA